MITDTITDEQIRQLWRDDMIDTRVRNVALRTYRGGQGETWRIEARARCAEILNARAAVSSPSMADKGPGRPPRAGKKLSTGRINLRLTEQELARWQRAADQRDQSMSELIRASVEAAITEDKRT